MLWEYAVRPEKMRKLYCFWRQLKFCCTHLLTCTKIYCLAFLCGSSDCALPNVHIRVLSLTGMLRVCEVWQIFCSPVRDCESCTKLKAPRAPFFGPGHYWRYRLSFYDEPYTWFMLVSPIKTNSIYSVVQGENGKCDHLHGDGNLLSCFISCVRVFYNFLLNLLKAGKSDGLYQNA